AGRSVVVAEAWGCLLPLGRVLRAAQDRRRQDVVPLLEDVGGDREAVAGLALHGIAPVINGGLHPADHDGTSFLLHRHRSTRYGFSSSKTRANRSVAWTAAVSGPPRVSSTSEAVQPR